MRKEKHYCTKCRKTTHCIGVVGDSKLKCQSCGVELEDHKEKEKHDGQSAQYSNESSTGDGRESV